MPRIMGIDVPREKRTEIALTYIYGIGRALSNKILAEAKVSPDKRAKDLTDQEVAALSTLIQRKYKVEGDLRREVQMNIKRLMDVKCYRGTRHIKGLPVRGQRSRTNSRTRKGPRKSMNIKIKKNAPAPS